MVEWRVYFSDGSTFDSTMGTPHDVPNKRVQTVIQKDEKRGRDILRMVDYFIWSPTLCRWVDIFDAAGLVQRAAIEPYLVIRVGEYIPTPDFERILIATQSDPDFPGRTPLKKSPMAGD